MVTYTKPQQRKKEEGEGLRGQGDQIKYIDRRFERWQILGLGELCWRKAMVAYTMPQQRKKEESEGLRGEGSQITFVDL